MNCWHTYTTAVFNSNNHIGPINVIRVRLGCTSPWCTISTNHVLYHLFNRRETHVNKREKIQRMFSRDYSHTKLLINNHIDLINWMLVFQSDLTPNPTHIERKYDTVNNLFFVCLLVFSFFSVKFEPSVLGIYWDFWKIG